MPTIGTPRFPPNVNAKPRRFILNHHTLYTYWNYLSLIIMLEAPLAEENSCNTKFATCHVNTMTTMTHRWKGREISWKLSCRHTMKQHLTPFLSKVFNRHEHMCAPMWPFVQSTTHGTTESDWKNEMILTKIWFHMNPHGSAYQGFAASLWAKQQHQCVLIVVKSPW